MYKTIVRPLFFLLDPEKIHTYLITALKIVDKIPFAGNLISAIYNYRSPKLEKEILGMKFKNPVGIAAGFDKDAEVFDILGDFGFGFVEIGTVTPKAQPGNPKPRIFRLIDKKSILNRMGFNNKGAKHSSNNLKKRRNKNIIIGGNIGKNKITPLENAVDDYLISFRELYSYVDYFAINISSPNTPDLRKLQEKSKLENLFKSIIDLNNTYDKQKPIFVKIAPDLSHAELADIISIVNKYDIAGIIATNTTLDRTNIDNTKYNIPQFENGGISGKLLTDKSTEIIKLIRKSLEDSKLIIGVGGIMTPQDAEEKLKSGADLIQVYTGFIYEGPGIVKRINKHLSKANN
ncbi:MAG: quinone-dependent dihydroorotate dehydrogenase [Saprospiraceae bacterium]